VLASNREHWANFAVLTNHNLAIVNLTAIAGCSPKSRRYCVMCGFQVGLVYDLTWVAFAVDWHFTEVAAWVDWQ
jgi:hypothetical protein